MRIGRTLFLAVFFLTFAYFQGSSIGEEKSVEALVSEGNALYLEGDFKGALKAYKEALLLEPEDPFKAKIHYNLGNTYYRLGDFENAIKEYEEALRLNPQDHDSKVNLELALWALQGEEGILVGVQSDVGGVSEMEVLEEKIRLILQGLEEEEFRNPKGVPIPPFPHEKPKDLKKDW